MRKKIIVANWKMNGSFVIVKNLCESFNNTYFFNKNIDIVLCVPFPYLDYVRNNIHMHNVSIGVQNISQHDSGSFTGEISISMIQDFNCLYVLVGHSERRYLFNDNFTVISEKIRQILSHGLIPILCIGENKDEYLSNNSCNVLKEQIHSCILQLPYSQLINIIIAYEPIWAIGTDLAASVSHIKKIHKFIRSSLKDINSTISENIKIIYGGSLNPSNASKIFALPNVDGGLIGRCSLNSKDFISIINQINIIS